MPPSAKLRVESAHQVIERLSMGESIENLRITGLLDLDPLVVSRWLCGEDMRGVYQPIVLHNCVIDGIDLEGRTFYDMVELVGCRIAAAHFAHAYFYSMVLIEDCIFEGDFHGKGIQNDERLVIHNAVFTGWAEFAEIDLRGRADLRGVSFLGGTNLLHVLSGNSHERVGRDITLSGCGFHASDVPAGLEPALWGIVPLVQGDARGTKS